MYVCRHGINDHDWGNVLSSYGLISLHGSDSDRNQSNKVALRMIIFVLIGCLHGRQHSDKDVGTLGVWGGVFGGCFTKAWRYLNPRRPKQRSWRMGEVALISIFTSCVMFAMVLSSRSDDWACSKCCDSTQASDDDNTLLCVVDDVDYQFGCSDGHVNTVVPLVASAVLILCS